MRCLRAALPRLSVGQLQGRHFAAEAHSLTAPEIAELLGESVGTVRWTACRDIEVRGVTTVGLALVKGIAIAAKDPRLLYLRWPFGHALGEPGNIAQQRTVLHDMLSMVTAAQIPGMVIELPYRWRRETYPSAIEWAQRSQVVAQSCSA